MYKNKFVIVFISLFLGCTENPFFKDQIKFSDKLSLTGQVRLEGSNDHSGIYVYADGLEIETETDKSGKFKITIPDNPRVQPGGGVSGFFNIYYYVANYKIEHSIVFINQGEFQFGVADLNEDGQIKNYSVLKKMLDVRTQVDPGTIKRNYSGKIKINVLLKNEVDSVIVLSHLTKDRDLASVYLNSDDTLHLISLEANLIATVIDSIKEWQMEFDWSRKANEVKPDLYEIIPYIQVYQKEIPLKLIERFGPGANMFSPEFLNIPFRRQNAELKVSEDSN